MPAGSADRTCTTATASVIWSSATRPAPRPACVSCSATCPSAAGQPPPRATVDRTGSPRPRRVRARASRAGPTTSATRCAAIVDGDSLLELCPRWARNMVTALARIDGRPVGDRRQPAPLSGRRARCRGSEKAARFVSFCDSFGLPLIAVVDTPGFMPGLAAGAGRGDPARRVAGAGVRRGQRAEAHRRAAQVLRWRVHHDELARPRRRPGPGLAGRRARDHERARRRRDRQPPRARALPEIPTRSATGWPTRTPTSTSAPTRGGRRGSSTRSSSRPRPAIGWPGRCALSPANRGRPLPRVILDGKRLLITGVLTKDSIAFHAAEQAQREGAEVLLTSFGRSRRMTERAAQRLPEPVDVLELDVNSPRRPGGADRRRCASAGAGWTARCTRSPSRPRMRSAASS